MSIADVMAAKQTNLFSNRNATVCNPFSCVVKSDLTVLVGGNLARHSHSEIIQSNGLPRECSINQYARVELSPEENEWMGDVATWSLKLDEYRTPEWWAENLPEIDGRVREAAIKWQNKLRTITEWHVVSGDHLILACDIKAKIAQSGGELRTYGNSRNVIAQSGGELRTCDSSQNEITQSGGELWTCGNSRNEITQSGGELWTYDNSQNVIAQSGGVLRTCDSSQNEITQSGGELWTYGDSRNEITQSGGELWTCGNSRNEITQSGGVLWTYGNKDQAVAKTENDMNQPL